MATNSVAQRLLSVLYKSAHVSQANDLEIPLSQKAYIPEHEAYGASWPRVWKKKASQHTLRVSKIDPKARLWNTHFTSPKPQQFPYLV